MKIFVGKKPNFCVFGSTNYIEVSNIAWDIEGYT